MTNAPRPSAESPTGDSSRSLFSRVFHYERPSVAANDTNLIRLASNREVVDGSAVERNWLQRHTIDRFVAHAEVDSELTTHGAEVRGQAGTVLTQATALGAVWNNERQLRRHNDQLERFNEEHGDQARYVIENQLREERLTEEERQRDEGEVDIANDNRAPEDEEERALREEAVEQWERFAVQNESTGLWQARSTAEVIFSRDSLTDRWQNRTSFLGFFRTMWADYMQLRAVRAVVPSVNVATFGLREGRERLEDYRETAETVGEGIETVVDGRRLQREVQREGAETIVLASETARSEYVRNQILRLLRGEVSREQVIASTRAAFDRFRQQDPQEFARMVRGYGMTARQLNSRAGFYELFKNAALWYTPWGDRGERSFWEANETAVPIWGSYAAWRDINVDNGLSLGARIGFASVGTLLDIGTVASFGLLTPVFAGGKALLFRGSATLAQRATAGGARIAAAQGSRRLGQLSLGELLGSMPRAARNAVSGAGSKAFVAGAAGYTALSAGIDWLFDIEDRAFDLAIAAAEQQLSTEFTTQQRRLLRLVGEEVDDVVEEAYEEYREEGEDDEILTAANDNQAPELTDGQIADVSESREAA